MLVFLTLGSFLEDHDSGFVQVNGQGPGLTELLQMI